MKQIPYIVHSADGSVVRATYCRLTNIININWVATIFYQEFGRDFNFQGESHDFWELVYADKGELIATAEERDVLLRQGDVIFHQPNEFHRLRANGTVAPNAFIMTFDCRSPAMKYFCGRHIHLNAQQRSIIAMILDETSKTFVDRLTDPESGALALKDNPILGGQQMIRTYLEQLLILLMRGDKENLIFPTKDTLDSHLVQTIIQLLEEHLYDNLTIEQISARLNYSRTYLCTVFKQSTGYSIIRYYTRLKIQEAKTLLREGKLNVSQISDRLAFCNPHYFSYIFRKNVHMSPREYQQSIQDRGLVVTRQIPREYCEESAEQNQPRKRRG